MKFAELEISDKTIKGLTDSNYESLTEIQQHAIPIALEGTDLLAKAKTGSGKTLSFLVPMLELLVKNNWGQLDGLGALVITPTRELALQIFNVLRKIGKYHSFSAGLIIGGKDLDSEKERVGRMNILVYLRKINLRFALPADCCSIWTNLPLLMFQIFWL